MKLDVGCCPYLNSRDPPIYSLCGIFTIDLNLLVNIASPSTHMIAFAGHYSRGLPLDPISFHYQRV
jgi:hypothetical protein